MSTDRSTFCTRKGDQSARSYRVRSAIEVALAAFLQSDLFLSLRFTLSEFVSVLANLKVRSQ